MQRRRKRVEAQILSNPSVHQARGRESAQPSQPVREATGGVSDLRAYVEGSSKHDVRHNARLVRSRHDRADVTAQGRERERAAAGSPYRLWVYRTFRAADSGEWTAKVLGPDGAELGSVKFQVEIAK